MTNVPRTDNFRPASIKYPVGSSVGIIFDGKTVTGKVNTYDGGDWIYVTWPSGSDINSYLRPTQLFPIE